MAVKKKPEEPKKGAPEYMSTYGDLVTLLLCFFVLLFSMSTIEVTKFQQVAASMSKNIITVGGGVGKSDLLGSGILEMPNVDRSINDSKQNFQTRSDNNANIIQQAASEELNKMASEFRTYFAENNVQSKVDVEIFDRYIKINMRDGVVFDPGKATIKPEALPILDIIAEELKVYTDSDFRIEGHTDDIPISTVQFPNNWVLSAVRATNVGLYFLDVKGFDPYRMSTEGFGEYRPVASNDTPEGRAMNRRVEIKILSKYYSGNN